ncbi:DoxX family protein [Streptomyces lanatus]|uniref:DoxX family protein n=1 Tax=Streptomyces lanatus TaxID=66900 RepID=A0ABV1XJW4_9ACTN|nr:DoxX family protein [Streptomyces lanatus]GHG90903.1 integral membrane protein [Streptomyces lanatus]
MTGRLNSAQPYAIGLFRIVVGLLFACHGANSLFGTFGGETLPSGTWPGWYAAVIELVGGSLVLLGLGTRAAAFIASGAMAYAYFKVHQPQALWPIENQGEGAAMYCWAMFLLIFTGSGAFGLDRLFAKRSGAQSRTAAEQTTPVAA